MARPSSGYRLADGTRVPGTTTIAKLIDDPGALIHWAWKEGHEGRDYRESRDQAAGHGTRVHELVELWVSSGRVGAGEVGLLHVPIYLEHEPEPVAKGFGAFLEWAEQSQLRVIKQEESLVSEEYRYGGTIDAIVKLKGRGLYIADWKTGKGIYPSVVLQLAAYRQLVQEEVYGTTIEGAHVIRFNRESAVFSHTSIPSELLDKGWEAFRDCLELYQLRRQIKDSL